MIDIQDLNIINEDEHILFIDKPRALHSAANPGANPSSDCIESRLQERSPHFYLLNRLDFYTSGIILVAKRAQVKDAVRELYQTGKIHKSYVALVEDIEAGLRLNQKIYSSGYLYSRYRRSKKVLFSATPIPRAIRTSCIITPISELAKGLYVVRADTNQGHRHIVRCHLAAQNCPLCKDKIYSSTTEKPWSGTLNLHQEDQGFFLRAYKISFTLFGKNYHVKLDWESALRDYVGPNLDT